MNGADVQDPGRIEKFLQLPLSMSALSLTTKHSSRVPAKSFVRSRLQYSLRLALVAVLYFVVGKLGLSIPFTSGNVSPVWPASGLAIAIVVFWGYEIWPALALGAFLVNFLSPIPSWSAAGIAIGNTASAVLGGCLLRRFARSQLSVPRLRGVVCLIAVAIASPMVAASIGTMALLLGHSEAWSGFGSAWRVWWLGDATGVLIVTPLLFTFRDLVESLRRARLIELLALSLVLLGTCFALFWRTGLARRDDVLAFVVFPFVIWGAIRFRTAGAAIMSLLVAAIAVWGTAEGTGPFVKHNPLHNVILLQMFITVTSLTGLILAAIIAERQRTEDRLLEQTQLLDLANDAIFVRTLDGRITYWNRGAERLYGWGREEVVGKPSHEIVHTEFPQPFSEIKSQLLRDGDWQGELRQTKRDGSLIDVASRWSVWRDRRGKVLGFLELNTDITEHKRSEESLRALSGRLLKVQDDERRRMARELHDGLGQYLAATKMALETLHNSDQPATAESLSGPLEIIERAIVETRTLSHLLHPPLLDEIGFASAASWYVEGFSKRSGIAATFQVPPQLQRLPGSVETALFRILQESLTNAHRHSGTQKLDIHIAVENSDLILTVQDYGRGIPQESLERFKSGGTEFGVGLSGMRERVKELGGMFDIQSGSAGTIVRISVPVSPEALAGLEGENQFRQFD